MRFEDFPFILDSKNGLVCCCVPVTPETEELTRSLRTYYAERAAQFGYVYGVAAPEPRSLFAE